MPVGGGGILSASGGGGILSASEGDSKCPGHLESPSIGS